MPAAQQPPLPEEPKTETTLTTRIRINIPGSRPIPPVVVRKPVGESATPATAASAPDQQAEPQPAPEPEPVAAPEPPRAEERTSDWFAPRKAAASAPSAPSPSGPAGAPAAGGPQAPSAARPSSPARGSGFAGPATGSIPTVAGPSISATPAGGTPMFLSTPQDEDAYGPDGDPFSPRGPKQPAGPTGGPVTGNSPVGGAPANGPEVPGPMGGGPVAGNPLAGNPLAGDPFGGPPPGGDPFGGAPAPRMSDDTAILTPQTPAPVPAAGDGAHVSGDTLTSGIPVVPPGPGLTPRSPERTAPDRGPAPRPAPTAPAKKGRSKLVLAGVGVFCLVGVAYGAGLLLNHSEVPKGTTVLGVDIGGGTKEEAVSALEATLGKRAHAPLKLSVDGKEVELAPDKAGLSLDSQETVRGAAGSDYNPVSVIGSLFGGERVAEPRLPIDEEKLAAALADVAGTSGSVTEGTIVFAPGKVTAVEGEPGKGLDVARSMIFVRDAYRAQVQTGKASVVELPVVTREPRITKAELDRAMREFAEPAMSGLITIKAGPKQIDFGPARSLPKILSMKAVDGRLVEVYDKKAIEELLDGVFDGIMITKGDGTKHQVSADDVAFAMRDALLGKTPAERTQEIALDGEG
ncbi:hypothetical protein OG393_10270 [Streptomyces sp. NBC_01216]|nr:hypothetical protein OG393_10270 [Streptomyces sp. NBC_01216]